MERERFLRAEFVTSTCRRFGHRPVRRVIGLQGACCTGVGEGNPVCIRRFQEARPRPSWDLTVPAYSRGGAPKGERSQMTAPASLCDAGTRGAPFGAPPPLFEGRQKRTPPVCLRHHSYRVNKSSDAIRIAGTR